MITTSASPTLIPVCGRSFPVVHRSTGPTLPRQWGLRCWGWIIVYVDDFAIVSSDPVSDKPIVPFGSGKTVEYLSVEVEAVSDGWLLGQKTYCADLLTQWSMQECRPVDSLEDVPENIEDEEEPPLAEVRLAQRMAGGLNWLATRTRPVSYTHLTLPTILRV